jgi:hypothetical protein
MPSSPLRDRRGSETLRVFEKLDETESVTTCSPNAKRFRAAMVTERTAVKIGRYFSRLLSPGIAKLVYELRTRETIPALTGRGYGRPAHWMLRIICRPDAPRLH